MIDPYQCPTYDHYIDTPQHYYGCDPTSKTDDDGGVFMTFYDKDTLTVVAHWLAQCDADLCRSFRVEFGLDSVTAKVSTNETQSDNTKNVYEQAGKRRNDPPSRFMEEEAFWSKAYDHVAERCPQCGPGYRIGDEGCSHTPKATVEEQVDKSRPVSECCPECKSWADHQEQVDGS